MATLQPWTQRLREMVQSGPSPFDLVLTQMAVTVPPGRAYRDTRDRNAWSQRRRSDVEEEERPMSEDEKADLIRAGRRRIAYQTIWTQKRQGVVDVYEEGGVKMVSKGPRFPEAR